MAVERVRMRTLLWWVLASLTAMSLLDLYGVPADDEAREVMTEYLFYGAILLGIVHACRRADVRLDSLVGPPPRDAGTWLWVLLALPLLAFSAGAFWLVFYPLSLLAPAYVEGILSSPDPSILVAARPFLSALMVIETSALGPTAEEFLFRGVLLHRLAARWGVRGAIGASSVAFGVMHLDPLGGAVFGGCMALLYLRTGALLVPIACHALYNALIIMTEFVPGQSGSPGSLAEFQAEWWQAALALACSTPVLAAAIQRMAQAADWNILPTA